MSMIYCFQYPVGPSTRQCILYHTCIAMSMFSVREIRGLNCTDSFFDCVGGQKVIRCELSLDDAKTWRLAEIKRVQDKPNRGGKYWAWVFWEIPVSTGKSCLTAQMKIACQ